MAYGELAVAIYLGALVAFINADGAMNRLFFKAPLVPASMALGVDALSRLNWI